ncbi:hypothetical protein MTR_1g024065 [Medicago truncatula]|uniref:Uncharacterized protein n=1 Tax=Medicago truncatula TaxID=3880 RepID=A0A072VDW5_MEDTR|nr:hypothetical protein MTR_1g024065 [Medicago truncatula]
MQLAVPLFDGFYDHLEKLLEILLHYKEYLSLIEKGVVKASSEQLKNNKNDVVMLRESREELNGRLRLGDKPYKCMASA